MAIVREDLQPLAAASRIQRPLDYELRTIGFQST
jgi:hypothetical protein